MEVLCLETAKKIQVMMVSSCDRKCTVVGAVHMISSATTAQTSAKVKELVQFLYGQGISVVSIGYIVIN